MCSSYVIKYTNIPDDLMVVEPFVRTIMDVITFPVTRQLHFHSDLSFAPFLGRE